MDRRPRIYYGWIIVGVATLSMMAWFGIRTGFAVFFPAMVTEFNWPRGQTAGVQSVAMLAYTLVAPAAGLLIDRYGPRRVILPGILLALAGLVLCSRIESLFQFYIYYGVIVGAGVTAIGLVSYMAILPHWFVRHRGLASGVAVSGMSLGTVVVVPLIRLMIDSGGWRNAFLTLAAVYAVILIPVNGLFLRHKPDQMGLYADGDGAPPPQKEGQAGTEGPDWTLARAARTPRFWSLLAFPFFMLIGMYIILVHFISFLVDAGFDPGRAAWMFSLMGLVSAIGRVFWGWFSDKTSRELTYSLGVLFLMSGFAAMILLARTGQAGWAWPSAVACGLGWGTTAPMFMATTADLFAGRSIGLIYGLVEAVLAVGGALGAWWAGLIFDLTGGYIWAFVLGGLTSALSLVGMLVTAPRKGPPLSRV